jgi:hypothetical protein
LAFAYLAKLPHQRQRFCHKKEGMMSRSQKFQKNYQKKYLYHFIIKSMKAFEIFVLEIKKENELFSNIEHVGSFASMILFQFCDVAKVGNQPSADLAKYGY